MLWVWGEPENAGSRPMRRWIAPEVPDREVSTQELRSLYPRILPRRGPPTKKMTAKQAAEAHKRHLEKAAARTKKWREKKGESNG